jgi:HK97 gp10 family phage protein
MATMKAKLPDELVAKLTRLGNKTDEVCEKALKAGAEIVERAVASNLSAVIGKDTKVASRGTGELKSSLGVTPVSLDDKGEYNIKIGFNEPRRVQTAAKGKRSYKVATNAMIANVLEYGKHGQPPKPFLKQAKNKSEKAATAKMAEVLESEMSKV